MDRHWTEADIAAFLDGELNEDERGRIARLLEIDAEAQACATRIRETDSLLRSAFAAPIAEPLPPAMKALLDEDSTVTPLRSTRARARQWVFPSAMAASIALLVGFATGSLFAPPPSGFDGERPDLALGPANAAVAHALDEAISGTTIDRVTPMASFKLAAGGICREFETAGQVEGVDASFGIACSNGGAWQIIMAANIAGNELEPAAGFVPASGSLADAALPVLDALGAGAAMTADEERQAMENGWR